METKMKRVACVGEAMIELSMMANHALTINLAQSDEAAHICNSVNRSPKYLSVKAQ